MGLFKKKKNDVDVMDEIMEWGLKNAQDEESKRYYEAQLDKEYQADLFAYFELLTEIKELYTVINNVGSFTSEAGNKLIALCSDAINMDISIKEKRDYYETSKPEHSEAYKVLAMVHEKRGDYQRAAAVCVIAIQNGYTKDGTNGGMRGRLARMIKKGNLPITDVMKETLNL